MLIGKKIILKLIDRFSRYTESDHSLHKKWHSPNQPYKKEGTGQWPINYITITTFVSKGINKTQISLWDLLWFGGISTIVGYLIPNPL